MIQNFKSQRNPVFANRHTCNCMRVQLGMRIEGSAEGGAEWSRVRRVGEGWGTDDDEDPLPFGRENLDVLNPTTLNPATLQPLKSTA